MGVHAVVCFKETYDLIQHLPTWRLLAAPSTTVPSAPPEEEVDQPHR